MDKVQAILKTAFAVGGKGKKSMIRGKSIKYNNKGGRKPRKKPNAVKGTDGKRVDYAIKKFEDEQQKKKESAERKQKQEAERQEDIRKEAERQEMKNLLQNVSSGPSKSNFKAFNSNPLIPNVKSATNLNSMPANLASVQNLYKPLAPLPSSGKDTPIKLGLIDDIVGKKNKINKGEGTHECYVKSPIYCNKDSCEDFGLPQCYERKEGKPAYPNFATVGGVMRLLAYKKYLESLNVDRLHKIAKSKGIKITKKTNGKTVYVKKATIIKKLNEYKYGKK